MHRAPRPHHDGNMLSTLVISVLGLMPVGVVSGMMLMQILGVWTY